MDGSTVALILQLQLEDVEAICNTHKGKGRGNEISDAELALRLYQRDLEQNATILSDKRIAESINDAAQLDDGLISASILQEQTAAQDRSIACQLSGDPDAIIAQPTVLTDDADERSLAIKGHALEGHGTEEAGEVLALEGHGTEESGEGLALGGHGSKDVGEGLVLEEGLRTEEGLAVETRPLSSVEGGEEQIAESSAWAMSRARTHTGGAHRCIVCQDSKGPKEVFQAHCEHEYCRDCLFNLFESSLTDVSLFPPRCCRQEMILESVEGFLGDNELVHLFKQRRIELGTADKTYCHSPTCSAFILPNNIYGDLATCEKCAFVTCAMCKLATHDGDCTADQGLQQILATAAEEGWQRCGKCKRVIELEYGCNHIT
jgi:hypothetical protein